MLTVFLAAPACTDDSAVSPDSTADADIPRGPHGKFDSPGSCQATLCDGQSLDGTCWCDDLCEGYGDCCADRAQVCEPDDDGDDTDEELDEEAFAPAACDGPPLTAERALTLFDAGTTEARLGVYRFFYRERVCNDATGCTAWTEKEIKLSSTTQYSGHLELRVGVTRFELTSGAGNVRIALGDWCQAQVGGQLACDLGVLFADGAEFSVSPGDITETCATMSAKRSVPLGDISRREENLVLRLDHGIDRGNISADLGAAFATPRPLTASCEFFRWDHQYTCQGAYSYKMPTPGSVTASLDGQSFIVTEPEGAFAYHGDGDHNLWLGTFALDDQGQTTRHEESSYAPSGSSQSMDAHVQVAGDLLIYEAKGYRDFGWVYAGCPTSGQARHCIAVYKVGVDD